MAGFAKLVPSARGLLVFEAAVRTGSFTAAAREFNVTQPSISRSIAQLEAHLGVGLFARGPAGLAPTAEARALYAAVSEAFEGIEGVIGTIRKNSDARPVVTLSLSSSLATHWFVPRLGAFDTRFPNVDLRFELIAGVLCEARPRTSTLPRDSWPTTIRIITTGHSVRKSSCRCAARPICRPTAS